MHRIDVRGELEALDLTLELVETYLTHQSLTDAALHLESELRQWSPLLDLVARKRQRLQRLLEDLASEEKSSDPDEDRERYFQRLMERSRAMANGGRQ